MTAPGKKPPYMTPTGLRTAVKNIASTQTARTTPRALATDIILDNITVAYEGIPILKDLTGRFKAGSLTALVGPNGGGKSTLLKAIMGMLSLKKGSITPHPTRRPGAPRCAYLPQISTVDHSFPLIVRDVVALGLCSQQGFFTSLGRNAYTRTMAALEMVGMHEYSETHLGALSGGQLQRILFARLSLQEADVILLDEPFAAIDAHTTQDLLALVQMWHKMGKTIIAVLHHDGLVREYFPETLMLARKIIAWGDTNTILTPAHHARAQEYAALWGNGTRHQNTPDHDPHDRHKQNVPAQREDEQDPKHV